MEKHEVAAAFDLMRTVLNERQWRVYLAVEAKRIGRGGITQVAHEAHASLGSARGPAAGAPLVAVHDPQILVPRFLPAQDSALQRSDPDDLLDLVRSGHLELQAPRAVSHSLALQPGTDSPAHLPSARSPHNVPLLLHRMP